MTTSAIAIAEETKKMRGKTMSRIKKLTQNSLL